MNRLATSWMRAETAGPALDLGSDVPVQPGIPQLRARAIPDQKPEEIGEVGSQRSRGDRGGKGEEPEVGDDPGQDEGHVPFQRRADEHGGGAVGDEEPLQAERALDHAAAMPGAGGLQRRIHVAEQVLLPDFSSRSARCSATSGWECTSESSTCVPGAGPPDEVLERVHGGGVDRRHVPHPDDEHLGLPETSVEGRP